MIQPATLVRVGVVVLAIGLVAQVFPAETERLAGVWVLPAVAVTASVLAAVLAESQPVRGLLVVLGACLTFSWARWAEASETHFIGACLGLLALVLVSRLVTSPARLRLAMGLFLTAGLALLVVGVLTVPDYHTWPALLLGVLPFDLPRITGLVQMDLKGLEASAVNPNALAGTALLIVPMGIGLLLVRTRDRRDWFWLFPLASLVTLAGAVVMAVSQSRTAAVAAWFTIVAGLVWSPKSVVTRVILGVLIVAPTFAVTSGLRALSRDAVAIQATDVWDSLQSRARLTDQGVQQLRLGPWLGVGINSFRVRYQPGPDTQPDRIPAHAHNIFLQTALDIGVMGSLAYWALFVILLTSASRAAQGPLPLARSAAMGGAMSLMAVTAFGFADAVVLGAKVGLLQWILGGVILAAARLQGQAAASALPSSVRPV